MHIRRVQLYALSILTAILLLGAPLHHAYAAGACTPNGVSFLGLPTWYKYLPGDTDKDGHCVPKISGCTSSVTGTCNAQSGVELANIWLIGLAILELLLRIGGLVAVGIVTFGGFKYITSQGSPDATKSARNTIVNAFIGIVIILIATVSVNFAAKLLQK